MLVIQPLGPDDVDALLQLVLGSGHGLTTLPKDRKILLERLTDTEKAFKYAKPGKPQGEDYLFGLIDKEKDQLVGVSGLVSKLGGFEPVYFYEIQNEIRESKEIAVKNTITTLKLSPMHSGPSEVCSLYLHPQYRKSSVGRLLSLSRLMFIADHCDYFEEEIIAEMRGMVDENGNNPFWNAVGSKFFKIDFMQADGLMMKSRKWIKEMLPDFPLVVNLLPLAARKVIGQVHPNTVPARKILEREGFSDSGLVAVLEPGPILKAKVNNLRTIKSSVSGVLKGFKDELDGDEHLISNKKFENFKCCLGKAVMENDGIYISKKVAKALKLKVGDQLRFSRLK